MPKAPNRPTRLGLAGLALIALTGTPAAAVALDQHVVDNMTHFVECWGYMWTDEASHILYCSPSTQAPIYQPVTAYGRAVLSLISPKAWSESAPPEEPCQDEECLPPCPETECLPPCDEEECGSGDL